MPTQTQIKNAGLLVRLCAKSNFHPMQLRSYARLESEGYMPLSIDVLNKSEESVALAMAHNSIQNGDVMADPDMGMVFFAEDAARNAPAHIVSTHYQNDFAGVYSEPSTPAQQDDLDGFLTMWLTNLIDQGHVRTEKSKAKDAET